MITAPLQFNQLTQYYQGKVRDVYTINNNLLVMIASDRISAFDVVLPKTIPYKGQVLYQIAAYMLQATSDICPNWLLQTPTPTATIGRKCQPFALEMVIRGNLVGHAWRTYSSGLRTLCGNHLPEGLKQNDYFAQPIITPSTKAALGHDEDITAQEIISRGLVSEMEWEKISSYTHKLFARGKKIAAEQGLILVDTKYEFGKIGNTIYLMDEIHTPDSSRYFIADGFEEKQATGQAQKQLSKEFVREWLIENNFMGQAGQNIPEMTDVWIDTISKRYIELYEKVIGEAFVPVPITDAENKRLIDIGLEGLF